MNIPTIYGNYQLSTSTNKLTKEEITDLINNELNERFAGEHNTVQMRELVIAVTRELLMKYIPDSPLLNNDVKIICDQRNNPPAALVKRELRINILAPDGHILY